MNQNPVQLKNVFTSDFLSDPSRVLGKEEVEKKDLETFIASHKFDVTKKPNADAPILFYGDIQIGSRGNILTITGKAKSRKTVIASAIASSMFLNGNSFLGFRSLVKHDEKILHIDTEQGYLHYYESVVRIFRDAGIPIPERFSSIHTRDATVELRIQLLEYLIELLKPAAVILDGVTDLVYDINSQEEATRVGELLLSLSYRFDLLIIAVIHTTKTTGYMTGALGTYLEKKCETSIKVTRDDDSEKGDANISHITCQYSRNKAFESFSIEYSERDKRYVVINDQRVSSKGPGGRTDPEAFDDSVHKAILTRVFVYRDSYDDHGLKIAISKAIKIVTDNDIRSKVIKTWIDFYSERLWISSGPEGAWMRVSETATSTGSETQTQTGLLNHSDGASTDGDTGSDDLPF
jgi:hypothetical protein